MCEKTHTKQVEWRLRSSLTLCSQCRRSAAVCRPVALSPCCFVALWRCSAILGWLCLVVCFVAASRLDFSLFCALLLRSCQLLTHTHTEARGCLLFGLNTRIIDAAVDVDADAAISRRSNKVPEIVLIGEVYTICALCSTFFWFLLLLLLFFCHSGERERGRESGGGGGRVAQ